MKPKTQFQICHARHVAEGRDELKKNDPAEYGRPGQVQKAVCVGIGPAPLAAIDEIRSGMLKSAPLLRRVANLPNRVCVPSHCPLLSIGIKWVVDREDKNVAINSEHPASAQMGGCFARPIAICSQLQDEYELPRDPPTELSGRAPTMSA